MLPASVNLHNVAEITAVVVRRENYIASVALRHFVEEVFKHGGFHFVSFRLPTVHSVDVDRIAIRPELKSKKAVTLQIAAFLILRLAWIKFPYQ